MATRASLYRVARKLCSRIRKKETANTIEYRNGTLNYSGQYTYAINGSTISITGEFDGKQQTVKATIKSWTDTQLVIDMGEETETYTKVTSIPYSDK